MNNGSNPENRADLAVVSRTATRLNSGAVPERMSNTNNSSHARVTLMTKYALQIADSMLMSLSNSRSVNNTRQYGKTTMSPGRTWVGLVTRQCITLDMIGVSYCLMTLDKKIRSD